MLAMISNGLAVPQVAKHFPDSRVWQLLAHELDHVRWAGCSAWDLIMPAFLFIVGVAMPFSYTARRARGDSWGRMLGHVLVRSLVLVALGVVIMTSWEGEINFINVLAQIGLAYPFAFLLVGRGRAAQVAAIAAILVGDWHWFYQHPLPGPGFDDASIGVPENWQHLTGMAAHWDLNAYPAAAVDRWLLNLFPRAEPFAFRAGGGTTLNFVPSIATILIGVIAGERLRSGGDPQRNLRWLLGAGVGCLAMGIAADPSILPFVETTAWTICPIVKRIWTPSYVLYTAGWALLGLALFYWRVDLRGRRRSVWPLTVVGLNSITMYCLAALSAGWIAGRLRFFLGSELFTGTFGPIWRSVLVLLVIWLVAVWMYRKRIFVRI